MTNYNFLATFLFQSLPSLPFRSFPFQSFLLKAFPLKLFLVKAVNLQSFALQSFPFQSFALQSFPFQSFALQSFLIFSKIAQGDLGWRCTMRACLSVFAQFLSAFITIR